MSQTVTIRASGLSGYADCALRAAAHAQPTLFGAAGFELHPASTNFGALIGSGVHAGAEVALKGKMLGDSVPLSTCEDAAIEEYRDRRRREADGKVLVGDETAGDHNQAEAQVRRMVDRYRKDVVAEAEPVAVERRLEAEVMPGVILSGQSDLLHLDRGQDAAKPREIVRDLKTTRRRSAHPMAHAPQIGSYSLLFRSRGHDPTEARLDLLPRVRLAKPQPPVERKDLDIEAAEQIAHAVAHEFGSKLLAFAQDGDARRFVPNPGSSLCSRKFCRLHGMPACPATRDR